MGMGRGTETTAACGAERMRFFFSLFFYLDGGVDGPEVDGLEDVPVELGGLVRLERQAHLDERVRESLQIRNTHTTKRGGGGTETQTKDVKPQMPTAAPREQGHD